MAKNQTSFKKGYIPWNKGKKLPPPWNKGKTKAEFPQLSNAGVKKGNISPWKGKTLTKAHCKAMSKGHIGQKIGEDNPNWKGGVTPFNEKLRRTIELKEWKKKVLKRDNYTCQECDKKGRLEIHHIIPFAECVELDYIEMTYNIDNGLTLCKDCHGVAA